MGESSDHHNNNDKQQHQEGEQVDDQGLLCKLPRVNSKPIKVESCGDDHDHDRDHDDQMMEGDEEGYKTPTKKEHRIKVDLTCPPPAPMKPRTQPMKRRRPSRRTLFQLSAQDFDLIFTPRSSSSSSTSTSVLSKDGDHTTHLDSPNKVNQHPNLTTAV